MEKCYDLTCQNRVDFKCQCQENVIFCCRLHFGDHISRSDSKIKHDFAKLYEQANLETKTIVLEFLTEKLKHLKLYKSNVMEKFHKKLDLLYKDHSQELQPIWEEIKNIEIYIGKIITLQEIPIGESDDKMGLLRMNSLEVKRRIDEVFNDLTISSTTDITDMDESYAESIDVFGGVSLKIKYQA